MAKWVSEDSTGRLASVVFAGSYDIVKQIIQDSYCVEAGRSAPETQVVGDGPVVSKAAMVVEEDARVIELFLRPKRTEYRWCLSVLMARGRLFHGRTQGIASDFPLAAKICCGPFGQAPVLK